MIAQRRAYQGAHFQELERHFEAFTDREREALAERFGAPAASARALAAQLIVAPERLHEALDQAPLSARSEELLEALLVEHGVQVTIHAAQASRSALDELRRAGLIVWAPDALKRARRATIKLLFPSALAIALAPRYGASRPSFALLSGGLSDAEVAALAERHQVAAGARLVMLIELAERYVEDHFLDGVLAQLDDQEQIGPAITALELGGMCYWQDVFGFGEGERLEEEFEGEAKVLPLIRDDALRSQQQMADLLLSLGVVFRFSLPESPWPMLAVPEELWMPLWTLARDWVLGWIEHTYGALRESALGQLEGDLEALSPRLFRQRLRWLCAELAAHPTGCRTPKLIERLNAQRPELDEAQIVALLEGAAELKMVRRRAKIEQLTAEAGELLARPAGELARRLLAAWCEGRGPRYAEEHVGRAFGLDETWRVMTHKALRLEGHPNSPPIPPWMMSAGVDHELTGMGYLRDLDDLQDSALLLSEFALTQSVLTASRLIWLDLLSTLIEGQSYATSTIAELLQFSAALSLFQHLAHLFERPQLSQYIPLQRPDYLTLPIHIDGFNDWSDSILERVLAPLGLARVDRGRRVSFRPRLLRVEGIEEIPNELRAQLIHDTLGYDSFPIGEIAARKQALGLRVLSTLRDIPPAEPSRHGEACSLDEPFAALRARLKGHRIERYDEERGLLHVRRRADELR